MANADGYITIGTELTTDKFDKQVLALEKKIQKEEQKAQIKIETKTSQEKQLEEQMRATDKLAEKYEKLLALKKEYQKAESQLLAPSLSAKDWNIAQEKIFQLQPYLSGKKGEFSQITDLEVQLDKAAKKEEQLRASIQKTENSYNEIIGKVSEYKQKIEGIKLQKQTAEVDRMKNSFNGVGSSIQKSIGKVIRLGLAVFGVRSAYLALRRASSDLATYDKQYATNLEYIRFVLTQAIAPVLRWIVEMTAKLLGYINAIMQGWFGINLFSRGSAESFNKMKKGATGTSKAVKQIKKDLMGFDEVNMLTDQSDTGTSAGAGGVGMPRF